MMLSFKFASFELSSTPDYACISETRTKIILLVKPSFQIQIIKALKIAGNMLPKFVVMNKQLMHLNPLS